MNCTPTFFFLVNVNRFWGGRSPFGDNRGILKLRGRKDDRREREGLCHVYIIVLPVLIEVV
jgi:hypothetical protein